MVRDWGPTKGGVVVRGDYECASGVGECAAVEECVLEWDGGSAVGGDEDAIYAHGEGNLYVVGDVWQGGGVRAEVGAVGDCLEEGVVYEVEGGGWGAVWVVVKMCIFACGLVDKCGEPL
jgi:hypothetical protein